MADLDPFFKTIRIIRKLNDPDGERVRDVIEQITAFTEKYKISIVGEKTSDSNTLFIGIGGDGTTMRAANEAARVQGTVLGINCGHLGFLSEFKAEKVVDLLTSLYKNSDGATFSREKRSVLIGKVHPTIESVTAVNEFFITAATKTCMTYDLVVDNEVIATQRSDGVIVCSPTGSTAYGLAAGGALIMPCCKVIQIVAVSPHALTNRPILVPQDTPIRIEASGGGQDVHLYVDGQKSPLPLNDKGKYVIDIGTTSRKYYYFVKSTSREHNFFNIIQEKLK